jgi:hypothetical protein
MDAVRTFGCLAALGLVAITPFGTDAMEARAQQRFTITPTQLEAFAARPGVKTAWSKFIGRLDGPKAYAIISAVALESETSMPRIMRRIRIELRHEGLRPRCDLVHVEWAVLCDREQATVYVEEGRLEALRTSVLAGSAEVHAGEPAGVTFYRSGIGSGLLLFGYSVQDRSLEEFAAMVAATQAALATAPR